MDVDRAPGAEGDSRHAVDRGADLRPHGADAPADDSRPRGALVERPMLALVGDVRLRRDALVGAEEPDVVAGRALDGLPPDETGWARIRLRHVRPAHVEAVRGAPLRDSLAGDGAHVPPERIGRACRPRQGDRDRDRGALQRVAPPDHRAVGEPALRRELELVAHGAAHWLPREGGRAREGVRRRLVGSQQEGLQAVGAGSAAFAAGANTSVARTTAARRTAGMPEQVSAPFRLRTSLVRGTARRQARARRPRVGRRSGRSSLRRGSKARATPGS
jgi:hypothetical protein